MSNYSIRKATHNDAEQLTQCNITCWREAYTGIFADQILSNLDTLITLERYKTTLNGDHNIYVIEINQQIIGFTIFGLARQDVSYSHEIYAIYVRSNYWRSGIGSKLLHFSETLIQEQAPKPSIYISTLEVNTRAIQFYTKHKYKLSTETKLFTLHGFTYPEVILYKSLM